MSADGFKTRGVLLDMGGVLLEMGNAYGFPQSRLDWRGREALVRWIREQGGRVELADLERLVFAPWRRDYEKRYDLGREARWEKHLKSLRRATGVRSRDLTLLEVWFRPYGEQLAPCEGAREAVESLERMGMKLAVVSNVPLPGALYLPVLQRHGLAEAFGSLRFSYDTGSRKPSPAMPRQALRELGVEAAQAVMAGDRRSSDVAAGRAAGMITVWIRGEDGGGPQPDYEIGSLRELPELLARVC